MASLPRVTSHTHTHIHTHTHTLYICSSAVSHPILPLTETNVCCMCEPVETHAHTHTHIHTLSPFDLFPFGSRGAQEYGLLSWSVSNTHTHRDTHKHDQEETLPAEEPSEGVVVDEEGVVDTDTDTDTHTYWWGGACGE